MNLYHIKLTDNQKAALEHLFSLDIDWNNTALEKAWQDLREHVADMTQCVAIINAIKPQYDPCRKFKKGDKVRVVERHGRYQPNIPCDELWKGLCTVAEDEDFCNNLIKVRSADGREKLSHWFYLELVTPVEELEAYYYVAKNDGVHPTFLVRNRNEEHRVAAICECWNEEDAQRICDMYNAEYRKEQR